MSKDPINIDIIFNQNRATKRDLKPMITYARKTGDPRLSELERIYKLLSECENGNYWFLKTRH